MSKNGKESVEAVASRVVDRLKAVREASAALAAGERRNAFEQTLEAELGGMAGDLAERVLGTVKERLVDEARGRERRVIELEQQVRALEAQLGAVGAERDRLRRDNEALRAGSAVPAAAAAPSTGGELARLREGLMRVSRGEDVTAESIGLPPGDARLFRLIRSLVDFALKYEIGLNLLLAEFKIGPAGNADTKLIQGLQEQVRERFRACLENKQGSLQALKEVLERNARFLVDLNRSYQTSIYEGNQAMLTRLDPRPILEKHKRVLGSDFEGAWRAIGREQADLANLSRAELWERFFLNPFQKKLASYQDQA